MDQHVKHLNLKLVARRDPEARHIWIAQTLQGDLVGQGSTLEIALEDLRNAVLSMLYLSVSRGEGADAFDIQALDEDQALFETVVRNGTPLDGGLTPEFFAQAGKTVGVVAGWVRLTYVTQGPAVVPERGVEFIRSGFSQQEACI